MYLHVGDGEEGRQLECNHINQMFCNLAENTAELLVKTDTTQLTTTFTYSQEPA